MNKYRTHNCNELTKENNGQKIILSGWINKKRDHGNLLFVDLRDNYGLTQCIVDKSNSSFKELEKIQLETVININGKVVNFQRNLHFGSVQTDKKNYQGYVYSGMVIINKKICTSVVTHIENIDIHLYIYI